MFSLDAQVLTFSIYVLQIILLPSQFFSFLSRRIEKTRSRFLFLSISFFVFNSIWIISDFKLGFSNPFESILPFAGIILSVQVYRYLIIELNIVSKRFSWNHLMIVLICVELVRQLLTGFPAFDRECLTFIFFLVYQLTAIVVVTLFIRSLLKKNINHTPLLIASMITFCIGCVIPVILFYIENELLKNPFINICFFAIGLAYAKFYFPQIRKEEKNRRLFISPRYFDSTISEKNSHIPSVFSECGLTKREYEILLDLLNGLSYQDIADKDFRSVATIRRQAATIFSKIGNVKDLKEFQSKFCN